MNREQRNCWRTRASSQESFSPLFHSKGCAQGSAEVRNHTFHPSTLAPQQPQEHLSAHNVQMCFSTIEMLIEVRHTCRSACRGEIGTKCDVIGLAPLQTCRSDILRTRESKAYLQRRALSANIIDSAVHHCAAISALQCRTRQM